jgi:hypothetical protein
MCGARLPQTIPFVNRPAPADEDAVLTPREEAVMYAVVAVAFIVLGAAVGAPLLNWICGPAFIVGGVTGLAAVHRWRKARQPRVHQ